MRRSQASAWLRPRSRSELQTLPGRRIPTRLLWATCKRNLRAISPLVALVRLKRRKTSLLQTKSYSRRLGPHLAGVPVISRNWPNVISYLVSQKPWVIVTSVCGPWPTLPPTSACGSLMVNVPGGIQTHSNGFGPCPLVALKLMAFEATTGFGISGTSVWSSRRLVCTSVLAMSYGRTLGFKEASPLLWETSVLKCHQWRKAKVGRWR